MLKTPEYDYPKSCMHFSRVVGWVIEVTADWLQLLSLKILSIYKGRLPKRTNQSILKDMNPEYSLEGLLMKHQYLAT